MARDTRWMVVGEYAFAVSADGRVRLLQRLTGSANYDEMTRAEIIATLMDALKRLHASGRDAA